MNGIHRWVLASGDALCQLGRDGGVVFEQFADPASEAVVHRSPLLSGFNEPAFAKTGEVATRVARRQPGAGGDLARRLLAVPQPGHDCEAGRVSHAPIELGENREVESAVICVIRQMMARRSQPDQRSG